jgi:hypothetical protein
LRLLLLYRRSSPTPLTLLHALVAAVVAAVALLRLPSPLLAQRLLSSLLLLQLLLPLLIVLLLYGRVVTTIAVSIVGPLQAILFLLHLRSRRCRRRCCDCC